MLTVKININDLVYELISEISSDEEASDETLERYLTSPSQGMPRIKHTERKTVDPPNPLISQGGLPLAVGGDQPEQQAGDGGTRGQTGRTRSPKKRPVLPSFSSDEDPGSGESSRSKRPRKDEALTS